MDLPPHIRLTSSLWPSPHDSGIHADISVEADVLLAVQERLAGQGHKVRLTALVLRAVGLTQLEFPQLNIRFSWGRPHLQNRWGTYLYMGSPTDHVGGARLEGPAGQSILEIQAELDRIDAKAEGRARPHLAKPGRRLGHLPWFLARPTLRFAGFLNRNFRVPIRMVGASADGWGAIGLTNIGSFGYEGVAFVPIPPLTQHILMLTVGRVHERPISRDGRVVSARVLPIGVVLDHRVFVGSSAVRMAASFRRNLTDAERLLGAGGAIAGPTAARSL